MKASKSKKYVANLLLQLDKLELKEAIGSFSKTELPGIKSPMEREKLRLSSTPSDTGKTPGAGMTTKAANWVKNTNDPYAREKLAPHLFNTSIIDKFGSLSADQQRGLEQGVANALDKTKEVNWTQFFYNEILANKTIKLCTFLTKNEDTPKPTTTPLAQKIVSDSYDISTYALSNYTTLFEAANYDTTVGDRRGDSLYLNSGQESRAYMRSVPPWLYVGSSGDNLKYQNFTQAKLSPRNEEAQKVTTFATSIMPQVRTDVFASLESQFKGETEKAFLAQFKHGNLPPVFIDSLMFGLVDVLNLPLSKNYGKGAQAGLKLQANPLITNNFYGENLTQVIPAVASDLMANLERITARENPYVTDISKLTAIVNSSKSRASLYNALTTVLFLNFGNLISKCAQAAGTNKFDLASIIELPSAQDKIDAYYDAVSNRSVAEEFNEKSSLPNPFIRLTFTKIPHNGKSVYLIHPLNVSGVAFQKQVQNSSVLFNTIPKTTDWKGCGLPSDAHAFILNKANLDYQRTDWDAYSRVLRSLNTKADTSQNAWAGSSLTSDDQVIAVLRSLYNEHTKSFNSEVVLFALIPRILYQCANHNVYSSRTKTLDILHLTTETLVRALRQNNNTVAGLDTLMADDNDFESVEKMRDDFMFKMYDINTSKQTIEELKSQFRILVTNLRTGLWSCEGWYDNNELGVIDLLSEGPGGDLQINPTLVPVTAAHLDGLRTDFMDKEMTKQRQKSKGKPARSGKKFQTP